MRSSPARSADLTTPARIRSAAIRLFARHGYADTSVRAIATEAGVSPGLVIHHFGSKEELKVTCDEYVSRELIDTEVAAANQDLIGTMQRWLAEPEAFQDEFDYLTRMFTDSSPTSNSLFDALVERTEQMLAEGAEAGQMHAFSDPKTAAVLVAIMGLGPLVFGQHVARNVGEDSLNTAALQKLALPALELYTHGLYTGPELLDATRDALDGGEHESGD